MLMRKRKKKLKNVKFRTWLFSREMAVKGLTLAFESEFSYCAPLSLPACDWEENKYTQVYHSYPENSRDEYTIARRSKYAYSM